MLLWRARRTSEGWVGRQRDTPLLGVLGRMPVVGRMTWWLTMAPREAGGRPEKLERGNCEEECLRGTTGGGVWWGRETGEEHGGPLTRASRLSSSSGTLSLGLGASSSCSSLSSPSPVRNRQGVFRPPDHGGGASLEESSEASSAPTSLCSPGPASGQGKRIRHPHGLI